MFAPAVLISLVSSFGLGALHAIEPGHGKTIVAAYLIGSRGRWYHAVYLGIVVTITHTLGILLLGLLAMYGMDQFRIDELHQWLQLVAGVLILGVGLWLLYWRVRGHHYHHGFGGHTHHHHVHDEHGAHVHTDHTHEHQHADAKDHLHADHDADAANMGERTGWSVTALGISGGLLPCPAAVAPLLYGVGHGDATLGVSGVAAFSIGLALVLIAVGLLVIRAQSFVERRFDSAGWIKHLPLVSAAIVSALGVVLIVESLI